MKMLFSALLIISFSGNFAKSMTEISGQFKECLIGASLNMLEFDEECYRDPDQYQSNFNRNFYKSDSHTPAFVFSKHNFILESKGFECKMLIHKYRYSKDFLLNKYIEKDIQIVQLSRSECLLMVKEKECGQLNHKKKMTCKKEHECSFVDVVQPEFPFYFGAIEKDFVECHVSERLVMAQNLNSTIFASSKEPCFAEDEVCYFQESIVVWEREAIRVCSFERLIDLPQLQRMPGSNGTIFFTKNDEYLFRITQMETHCGIEFYLTTEGLYLSFYDNDEALKDKLLQLPPSKYNINHFVDKDRNDLILAENDFQKYKMNELTMDVACSMFMNTIQASINNDDTFLVLNYLG
jgi:hypothetical protein